jgi:hypothetical protein
MKGAEHFEKKGFAVTYERQVKGNGAIDLLAERPGERVAIEVETGKPDIRANLSKASVGGFDRLVLVATPAFQRCDACGGELAVAIRRYRCRQCGADATLRFLFDGLVFDAEYFRQKMYECRSRKQDLLPSDLPNAGLPAAGYQ